MKDQVWWRASLEIDGDLWELVLVVLDEVVDVGIGAQFSVAYLQNSPDIFHGHGHGFLLRATIEAVVHKLCRTKRSHEVGVRFPTFSQAGHTRERVQEKKERHLRTDLGKKSVSSPTESLSSSK